MADSLILHRGAMAGRKEEAEEFPRCVTSALFRVICFVLFYFVLFLSLFYLIWTILDTFREGSDQEK